MSWHMVTKWQHLLLPSPMSNAQNLIEISKCNGRKKHRKEDDLGCRVDLFKGTGQNSLSNSEAEKACSDVLWRVFYRGLLKRQGCIFCCHMKFCTGLSEWYGIKGLQKIVSLSIDKLCFWMHLQTLSLIFNCSSGQKLTPPATSHQIYRYHFLNERNPEVGVKPFCVPWGLYNVSSSQGNLVLKWRIKSQSTAQVN